MRLKIVCTLPSLLSTIVAELVQFLKLLFKKGKEGACTNPHHREWVDIAVEDHLLLPSTY